MTLFLSRRLFPKKVLPRGRKREKKLSNLICCHSAYKKKEDKEREAACFENAFFLHSMEHTFFPCALAICCVASNGSSGRKEDAFTVVVE